MTENSQKKVVYVVSELSVKIASLLPSNKNRSLFVHSLVNKLGLFARHDESLSKLHVIRPSYATDSELLAYHDPDYIAFVLNVGDSKQQRNSGDNLIEYSTFGIEDDCPPFLGLPQYVRMIAGATLTAVKSIVDGTADIAISWDGGRHHTEKSRASGFCYVADCVLAILALKKSLPMRNQGTLLANEKAQTKPRIMYLDLDLHYCDAVSQAFSGRNSSGVSHILILSLHHSSAGFFPATQLSALSDPNAADFDPFNVSIPLKVGASSKSIENVWNNSVEPIRKAFGPDAVIMQCGVDGLAGDPCGIWNWRIGLEPGDMGWCVQEVIQNWNCKVLLLGGGGYNSPNAARAWSHLTSVAIGRPLSLETHIPDHSLFPQYAPSFILDVPQGNMPDENTVEYLSEVGRRSSVIAQIITERMSSAFR